MLWDARISRLSADLALRPKRHLSYGPHGLSNILVHYGTPAIARPSHWRGQTRAPKFCRSSEKTPGLAPNLGQKEHMLPRKVPGSGLYSLSAIDAAPVRMLSKPDSKLCQRMSRSRSPTMRPLRH